MIVAEELTKKYGSHLAVDGISFRVPRGEVVGFLGPNGAGKSTTLRMVAGFLPPTSGTVTVAGFDVVEDPLEARRKLGYMPEAVPLYPEMRVEEYLAFRAEIKGVTRNRKDAVRRAMEQADVADVSRRLIGELSKGYRQRVGLADALVSEPELLILDEPTAGLDPNQILHVRELIKSLGKRHTIFLSTHILPEVEAVCSRVVIVSRGRVVAEGAPDEIRARMASQGRNATLVVRGDEARAQAVVRGVAGVSVKGEPTRVEVGGAHVVLRFVLDLDDKNGRAGALAEELAAACVGAGLGLRGLEITGKSLEAIFHELTTTDVETASEGDAKGATGAKPAKRARDEGGASAEPAPRDPSEAPRNRRRAPGAATKPAARKDEPQ